MSFFKITPPNEGEITIALDWQEAEVLARILGLVVSGDLAMHAPTLNGAAVRLLEHLDHSGEFVATAVGNQIYIEPTHVG